MSDAQITGTRRRTRQLTDLRFAVGTNGNSLFVYCEQKKCPWIKPVPNNSTLSTIERVALTHRCRSK